MNRIREPTGEARTVDTRRDRYLQALQALLDLPATQLGPAMNRASEVILELTGADKIDVFLLDPSSTTLVAVGTSDTPMGRRQVALGLNRLPLANGGRAVESYETGRTWVHGRVKEDPGELPGIREGLAVQSEVNVPLHVGEQRRGVLGVQSARPDFFADDDVRFLEAIARWIGAVAHRVELTESVTRSAIQEGRRVAAEEILTILAHDIRNHLNPVNTRLQLVLRRAQRLGAAEFTRDAEAGLRSMRAVIRLISDLLDIARLDQGVFTISAEVVDLVALVREVAATAATPRVDVKLTGPEELVCHADPNRLRQALENVVANAVKHSPAGLAVSVDVQEESRAGGAFARVTVADQGPGVAPELLPRLFDRFVKGSASSGLGLGLYLARRIAEGHGGTLEVTSEPGRGTRFVLAIPVDPEHGG